MPQLIIRKTDQLSEISDAGTAAALDVPVAGDAGQAQVVKGDDSRLSDLREWARVAFDGQTLGNHSESVLDLGADHGIVVGDVIRIRQAATGDAWRYAFIEAVSANTITAGMGEAFSAASPITAMEKTAALLKMTYIFDGTPLNEATADLWAAINGTGPDFWTGRSFKILGMRHQLGVADGMTGGGLNMTINDGAKVFNSDTVMDSIMTGTGAASGSEADPSNNTVNDTDTIQFKTTAPGSGDQAGLRVDVIGVFV